MKPVWDIFCAVVDNFGDIGVCWRLARQLEREHGVAARLWVDDLASFARICPDVAPESREQMVQGVEVLHWAEPLPARQPGDVVIEAFACELPAGFVEAMAARGVPPLWINLEYLSAEPWVRDCHAMVSRHPRLPLTKYFFFPGFEAGTGGLLCEGDLERARAGFDHAARQAFLARLGVPALMAGELCVSLFSYANPALDALFDAWRHSPRPVRALIPEGRAAERLAARFGAPSQAGDCWRLGALTAHILPFVEQPDYDRLLWCCDINFVRGEDSFVRAQWAGRPFVWHIYPQEDDAHRAKLDAFLALYCAALPAGQTETVRRMWHAWNGDGEVDHAWPAFAALDTELARHGEGWAASLRTLGDLAGNLARFSQSRL